MRSFWSGSQPIGTTRQERQAASTQGESSETALFKRARQGAHGFGPGRCNRAELRWQTSNETRTVKPPQLRSDGSSSCTGA
jgi:hypothetical protein